MPNVSPRVEELVELCGHDARLLEHVVEFAELLADRRKRERDLARASTRDDSPIQMD